MADTALLVRAADFAARYHAGQMRKDGKTPYLNHPLRVAAILSAEGGITAAATLAAAYLHDTVEDTAATFADLERLFPSDVVEIVRQVTDDKSVPKEERKRLQVVHTAATGDDAMLPEAKALKVADKIANLRDLQLAPPVDWPRERALAYFAWAKEVTDNCRDINRRLDCAVDLLYAQGPFYHQDKPDGVSTVGRKCPDCGRPMPGLFSTRTCNECMYEAAAASTNM